MAKANGQGPAGPVPTAGAVDLGALKKVDSPVAAEAQAVMEGRLGMRCNGCHSRIDVGFLFVQIVPTMAEGKPTVESRKFAACARDVCGYAEMMAREPETVAMEPIEFAWLDGPTPVLDKGDREPVDVVEPPV